MSITIQLEWTIPTGNTGLYATIRKVAYATIRKVDVSTCEPTQEMWTVESARMRGDHQHPVQSRTAVADLRKYNFLTSFANACEQARDVGDMATGVRYRSPQAQPETAEAAVGRGRR